MAVPGPGLPVQVESEEELVEGPGVVIISRVPKRRHIMIISNIQRVLLYDDIQRRDTWEFLDYR